MSRRAITLAPVMATLALTLLMGSCSKNDGNPASTRMSESTPCDLNIRPCEVKTLWGKMVVSLAPKPLPLLRPILIEARFEHPNGTNAMVELSGAEMDMGPNTTLLQRADGLIRRGALVIPICLTGSMRWRLSVHLTEGARSETAHFEVVTPGEAVNTAQTKH